MTLSPCSDKVERGGHWWRVKIKEGIQAIKLTV